MEDLNRADLYNLCLIQRLALYEALGLVARLTNLSTNQVTKLTTAAMMTGAERLTGEGHLSQADVEATAQAFGVVDDYVAKSVFGVSLTRPGARN